MATQLRGLALTCVNFRCLWSMSNSYTSPRKFIASHLYICVKRMAFCDLWIRLTTHRKSVRKFWFCKLLWLASTCESVSKSRWTDFERDPCQLNHSGLLAIWLVTAYTYQYRLVYYVTKSGKVWYHMSWREGLVRKCNNANISMCTSVYISCRKKKMLLFSTSDWDSVNHLHRERKLQFRYTIARTPIKTHMNRNFSRWLS